jgi:hypothetical protein
MITLKRCIDEQLVPAKKKDEQLVVSILSRA